jgi:hypothetical protein
MGGLRTTVLAPLALALGLLAGCGHTQVLARGRTLFVALTEYRIAPQDARVSAGPLTMLVHNYGRLAHNLVIGRGGQAAAATRPLQPGQSAELTITLYPGAYQLTSTIQSDQTLGAYGTLSVR